MVIPGLSPRVRGNHHGVAHQLQQHGSIPASAGEPVAIRLLKCLSTVYPRECGGTVIWQAGGRDCPGLSPRVRGNQGFRIPGNLWGRSIPASAGEPTVSGSPAISLKVYPRECGGTARRCCRSRNPSGLSPRVRGNPQGKRPLYPNRRSIPASAGEPAVLEHVRIILEVYPRECGGTASFTASTVALGGLSPRVRGNRERAAASYRKRG